MKFLWAKIRSIDFSRIKRLDLLAFLIVISAAAFYLRYLNFPFQSGDYIFFLKGWYADIDAAGGLAGIGKVYGNYTPAYMYLMALMTYLPVSDLVAIKLFSIVFDYVMAVFVGLIVRRIAKNDTAALIAYTACLFLPNVFINSAIWAQCDSIFTCFLVMSFYFMLKEKSIPASVCFGIAFSFKLQAIFFLPVFILAVLKKKIKWWTVVFVPIVFFVFGLPAVLSGMSFSDAYGVYFLQADYYDQLTLNAPNLYLWIKKMISAVDYDTFADSLVFFAFGVVGCTMLPFYKKKFDANDDLTWVGMAAFFAALMPFVLPHMHERYWYVSDIFSLIFFVCKPNKWYISAALIVPSYYSLHLYLFGGDSSKLASFAVILLVGILLLGAWLWERISKPRETPA